MFRPSRPMIRPFMSSDVELDDRDGGLGRVAAGYALHGRGQDAAGPAVGVVARLLLGLADCTGAIPAQVVLELPLEQLLGLGRGKAGDPLELADVLDLRVLEGIGLLLGFAKRSWRARSVRAASSRRASSWASLASRRSSTRASSTLRASSSLDAGAARAGAAPGGGGRCLPRTSLSNEHDRCGDHRSEHSCQDDFHLANFVFSGAGRPRLGVVLNGLLGTRGHSQAACQAYDSPPGDTSARTVAGACVHFRVPSQPCVQAAWASASGGAVASGTSSSAGGSATATGREGDRSMPSAS